MLLYSVTYHEFDIPISMNHLQACSIGAEATCMAATCADLHVETPNAGPQVARLPWCKVSTLHCTVYNAVVHRRICA